MSDPISFSSLRAALRHLHLAQAKQLHDELGSLIHELETASAIEVPIHKSREVVELQRVGDTLYQFERIRCGKPNCKCAGETGELHGPYWYAYWRDNGRLRSKYVGKKLRLEKKH